MFFDNVSEIPTLAQGTNFCIFVIDPSVELGLKNSYYLRPDKEKNTISIDNVREFLQLTGNKQTSDIYLVIANAETMTPESMNALLKNLEEPKDHYHFILLTKTPSALLPTILSRAQIFYLREKNSLSTSVEASEEIKKYAKILLSARVAELPQIAEEMKKKERLFSKQVVATAIELSYKTFFATKNTKFLQKLPNLINLYDNLSAGGHIKTHFVADML